MILSVMLSILLLMANTIRRCLIIENLLVTGNTIAVVPIMLLRLLSEQGCSTLILIG